MTSSLLKPLLLECVLVWLIQEMAASLQNVALYRPAFQTSTYQYHSASNAVDGNTQADLDLGTCSHTNDRSYYNPWWKVDLGEYYLVEKIYVYNRQDCCEERLRNVYFEVSNDNRNFRHFAFHSGQVPRFKTIYPYKSMYARWIRIRLDGQVVLTLCEVQVMSRSTMRKIAVDKYPRAEDLVVKVNSAPVPLKNVIECIRACSRTEKSFKMRLVDQNTVSPFLECYCPI